MTKYYLLLVATAFVLYGNTIGHDFALDDGIYITNHKSVQKGVDGIGEIFTKGSTEGFNESAGQQPYRPVTLSTFAIGKSLFDNKTGMEHFIQILLYALAGIMLFRLLKLWFPDPKSQIPLLCTLLFMAHPVHTEVVANIKSRDELLAGLFSISCLFFIHQYSRERKVMTIFLAALSFLLALLSKENAITILAIIPLSLYFFESISIKRILAASAPFLVLTIGYLAIRMSIVGGAADASENDIINNILNGAENNSQRIGTIATLLGAYLRLLFIPVNLSWDYSYNQIPIAELSSPSALISIAIHIGLLVFAIAKFRKKSAIAFGIIFYFITSTVTSNIFFLNGATLAERFLFLPSLGFCIAITVLAKELLQKYGKEDKKQDLYLRYGGIGLVALFAVITIPRNRVWENNYRLFESGVESAPNSARTHASFAFACKNEAFAVTDNNEGQKLLAQSEKEFKESLKIYPGYEYALYNLAVLYYETSRKKEALSMYLQLLSKNAKHIDAHNNAGILYFENKQLDSAFIHFQLALRQDPENAAALKNTGAVYHTRNSLDTALSFYQRSLASNPNNKGVYQNMILIYKTRNDAKKVAEYELKMSEIEE